MKLPNGKSAKLGAKIEDYVLNPAHRGGQHKARVFEAALGISLVNKHELEDALLSAAANADQFESRGDNGHGEVFVLKFPYQNGCGTATILSAWIVLQEEDFPRLVTCYII